MKYTTKKYLLALCLILPLLLSQCAVNKQISQAKTLGDCRYNLASADSIYLAGIDVRELRNTKDFNPLKYPRLATGLLLRNVPLDVRLNLDVTNPTARPAGINQFEYRILLAGQELFNGFINQRVEVLPGGTTRIPFRLSTNAYQLITDASTRDAFTQLVQNLAGSGNTKPSELTIKLKPTLDMLGGQINYPGYITIQKQIDNKTVSGN